MRGKKLERNILLNQSIKKLIQDVLSVKVWTLWASIGLLMSGYISGANFTYIVVAVIGARTYAQSNTTES